MNLILKLFDPAGFPARWNCGKWSSFLGWVHITSDILIWLAYFSIPAIILYYTVSREKVNFPSLYYLFAAFIFFCGLTHLNEAIIFWNPIYRWAGFIKACTAVVSWVTVIALVPLIPKALDLSSNEKKK